MIVELRMTADDLDKGAFSMKNTLKKMIAMCLTMLMLVAYAAAFAEEIAVEPTTAPEADVTVVTEPTTAPEADEAKEEETAPEAEPEEAEPTVEPVTFAGTATIRLETEGELYYGDTVVLCAEIEDANLPYAIRWEYNDGNGWNVIKDEDGKKYEFEITEKNAEYEYRVVLVPAE